MNKQKLIALAKVLAIPLALAGGYEANSHFGKPSAPTGWEAVAPAGTPLMQPASFAPSPSTPTPTPKVTEREFVVAGTYTTQAGIWLLNSSDDYTDPAAVTAVVSPKRLKLAQADASELVGRTVRVRGRASQYKGKPQIIADAIQVK